MANYTLTLTPIEAACGVTLEAVADRLPLAAVRGGMAVLPAGVAPALAGAVARCALAGPVEFLHLVNGLYPVYAPA